MTPEARRIAIAEALGVIHAKFSPHFGCWMGYNSANQRVPVPEYPRDLNAMREAEKTLNPEQSQKYFQIIRLIIGPTPEGEDVTIKRFYIHATAAQRAEAFLRTLNLWDDNL